MGWCGLAVRTGSGGLCRPDNAQNLSLPPTSTPCSTLGPGHIKHKSQGTFPAVGIPRMPTGPPAHPGVWTHRLPGAHAHCVALIPADTAHTRTSHLHSRTACCEIPTLWTFESGIVQHAEWDRPCCRASPESQDRPHGP